MLALRSSVKLCSKLELYPVLWILSSRVSFSELLNIPFMSLFSIDQIGNFVDFKSNVPNIFQRYALVLVAYIQYD